MTMKPKRTFHYLGAVIAAMGFNAAANAQGNPPDEENRNERSFGNKKLPLIMQAFDLDGSNHLDPTEFLEFKKAKKEAGGEIGY